MSSHRHIRGAAALLALSMALPAPTFAQGFFDLYRSAPRAPATEVSAAAPSMSFMPSGPLSPVSDSFPGLSQIANGAFPDVVGEDTVIPSLGENFSAAPIALAQSFGATSPVGDMGACIASIRAAEKRHGIPENLLMAIGLQEAGRERDGQLTIWPWSINSHGKTSMFETKAEAIAFVHSERAAGKTLIDMGCMQVNQRWHPDAFASLEEAFDPNASAEYAAKFLSRLHADAGDWMRSAGNYHSFTPQHHQRYMVGIRKNLEVAMAYGAEFDALAGAATSPVSPQNENFAVAAAPVLRQGAGMSLAGARGYMRKSEQMPERMASLAPQTVFAAPAPAAPRERQTGAWWSSDTGGTTQARSIYSRNDLKPVIPALD